MSAPRLVALVGPTGTGKTALACAIADRVPCRLISCDALQVYRGLDAATAKPEGEERRHPWALVDWVDPREDVNLGRFARAAEAEVAAAAAEGRTALLVGGTGLYLRGLLKGVAEAPPRDEALRARLTALAARRGVPFLHRVLARLDPRTAARLAPNDRQRLARALEVRLLTGTSLAALQDGGWARPDRFPALKFGLTLPREELYARLDARAAGFFARGLVAEVRRLVEEEGVPREANALRAIGYREVVRALAAEGPPDEAALVEETRRATRQYAKRQLTWFRGEPGIEWFDARTPGLADELAARIAAFASPPRDAASV